MNDELPRIRAMKRNGSDGNHHEPDRPNRPGGAESCPQRANRAAGGRIVPPAAPIVPEGRLTIARQFHWRVSDQNGTCIPEGCLNHHHDSFPQRPNVHP